MTGVMGGPRRVGSWPRPRGRDGPSPSPPAGAGLQVSGALVPPPPAGGEGGAGPRTAHGRGRRPRSGSGAGTGGGRRCWRGSRGQRQRPPRYRRARGRQARRRRSSRGSVRPDPHAAERIAGPGGPVSRYSTRRHHRVPYAASPSRSICRGPVSMRWLIRAPARDAGDAAHHVGERRPRVVLSATRPMISFPAPPRVDRPAAPALPASCALPRAWRCRWTWLASRGVTDLPRSHQRTFRCLLPKRMRRFYPASSAPGGACFPAAWTKRS